MGLFDFLSGIFKEQPKEIKYNLSQQSVKDNIIIKGQQNQIAELKGIVGRFISEKSERKELDTQKETEEGVKQYLQEDKKRLIQSNQQKFFSLKEFFKQYLKSESFRKGLHITTFNR